MAAYLIVRAVVPEAEREKFDQWYQDVHLPEALSAFDSESAWRGWSDDCLLYTSPSPRDQRGSRMPSSA